MGLRSKISYDLTRFSRIHWGSPLMRESSSMTSREMPLRATSWPCSFSLIGLGRAILVLSVLAISSKSNSEVRDRHSNDAGASGCDDELVGTPEQPD